MKRYESPHKVRSFECDSYGHVNNAVYLNYLEFARMEILESKGLTLQRLKSAGFLIIITRIDIQYRFPAVESDELRIVTTLEQSRRVSATFRQQIERAADNRVIATAAVTWAVVNPEGRPIPIPPLVRTAFELPLT